MNRIKVRDQYGNVYWYNPNTGRLFRSRDGMDEVIEFRYVNGNVIIPEGRGPGQNPGPGPTNVPPGYDQDDSPTAPPGSTPEETGPDPCPEGWHMDWDKKVCVKDTNAEDEDTLALLTQFLQEWGLTDLLPFVEQALQNGWSYNRILLELRKTPEYLAAFPENGLRTEGGYSWMSEADILQYRNEAKRLANQYFGADLTKDEIANLIGSNISLAEFEHKLVVGKRVQDYGPAVKQLFETSLGISLSDENLEEFLDEEINTEEWDRAYQDARYRGQPTLLGLDIRSQDEADLLRAMGVDPDEAFSRYESVAMNTPRYQRLASLEEGITQNLPEDFGAFLKDIQNNSLVRALVFQDPEALAQLQASTARELARFRVGGGAVFSGGRGVGLQTQYERSTG